MAQGNRVARANCIYNFPDDLLQYLNGLSTSLDDTPVRITAPMEESSRTSEKHRDISVTGEAEQFS